MACFTFNQNYKCGSYRNRSTELRFKQKCSTVLKYHVPHHVVYCWLLFWLFYHDKQQIIITKHLIRHSNTHKNRKNARMWLCVSNPFVCVLSSNFRRMFPTVRVSFSGLVRPSKPTDFYAVLLDIVPVDSRRYRYAYHRSAWLVAGMFIHTPPSLLPFLFDTFPIHAAYHNKPNCHLSFVLSLSAYAYVHLA